MRMCVQRSTLDSNLHWMRSKKQFITWKFERKWMPCMRLVSAAAALTMECFNGKLHACIAFCELSFSQTSRSRPMKIESSRALSFRRAAFAYQNASRCRWSDCKKAQRKIYVYMQWDAARRDWHQFITCEMSYCYCCWQNFILVYPRFRKMPRLTRLLLRDAHKSI